MRTLSKRKISFATLVIMFFFVLAGFPEVLEARSAGGGRSYGSRPSVSRPSSLPRQSTMGQQTTRPPFSNPMGGSFARGLAGGVMGGVLGSMLFGGAAHGMGGGGIGGSGFGLFELLILGGLGYFLYRRFTRAKALSPHPTEAPVQSQNAMSRLFSASGAQPQPQAYENPEEDVVVAGVRQIWAVDGDFHPDVFKETAQDLFFKVQAGWTRRETGVLKDLVGDQLLAEYDKRFAAMKQEGHINRLENIAVRKIEIVNAGVQDGEIFVTVKFTANLLDYTVDEHSNAVVTGDRENPVKFEEDWTFACPVGTRRWKLEGIAA